MSQTNVLYVAPSSGIGGAETFIKATYMGHQRARINPSYLAFKKGPLTDWLIQAGAQVEILDQPPRLSNPSTWRKVHHHIISHIQKNNISIVHSTMAYGALFTSLSTQGRCRHVWFQHGPASGWMDTLAGRLPHCGLITNSHYTSQRQFSLEKLGHPPRKCLQLNLGTPTPQIDLKKSLALRSQWIEKFKLKDSTVIISMLCRIQSWKGIHLLIEALRHLKNQGLNEDVFVIVWGDAFGGDSYFNDLKIKAQGLPVHFAGVTDDNLLSLSVTDILVNASTQPEPFGLSIIEAMSVKTAVVAADWGGPKEILDNNTYGLLFKPNDSLALAQTLTHLITHSEELNQYKDLAYQRYLSHYTIEKMILSLEDFYISL